MDKNNTHKRIDEYFDNITPEELEKKLIEHGCKIEDMNQNNIKPQELRIGNWVWNEVQQIPVQVDIKILQEQINASKGIGQYWKPIPLSEEVLLKAGFEDISSYKDYWLTIEDDLRIEISIRHSDRFYTSISDVGVSSKILYLHQLQNLYYSLTGEELEVRWT